VVKHLVKWVRLFRTFQVLKCTKRWHLEITKFYYTAGMHEPGAALSLATNLDVFESLSPAHQKVIETASGEAHQWNLAQFMNNNGAALQRLQAGGVKVLEFPDSVWDAMGTAAAETMDQYNGDELFDLDQ